MTRPHDSWAEVYDLAYQEEFGSFYEQFTQFTVNEIRSLVAIPASIVDFGAGSGRLAIPLARAGYRVTAVEPSAAMLGQLRSAAPDLDIPCIESAMQDFRGDARFDLAICVFTVITYLLDEYQLRSALQCARDCLNPDGQLLLDVPSASLFASHGCSTERLIRKVSIRSVGGDVHEYREEVGLLGAEGVERVYRDTFLIRAWRTEEVLDIACQCDFRLVENLSTRFGGTGSDYLLLAPASHGTPRSSLPKCP